MVDYGNYRVTTYIRQKKRKKTKQHYSILSKIPIGVPIVIISPTFMKNMTS